MLKTSFKINVNLYDSALYVFVDIVRKQSVRMITFHSGKKCCIASIPSLVKLTCGTFTFGAYLETCSFCLGKESSYFTNFTGCERREISNSFVLQGFISRRQNFNGTVEGLELGAPTPMNHIGDDLCINTQFKNASTKYTKTDIPTKKNLRCCLYFE